MKCRPFSPQRTWRKSTGAPEDSQDRQRRDELDGQRHDEEQEREGEVDRPLGRELDGVGRGRREAQERDSVELLEHRPREHVREDIERDVRPHAVALGDEQGLLVLAELALLDDEDHLVDHLGGEDRLHVRDPSEAGPPALEADLSPVVVVEVADHPEAPVGVGLEKVAELRGLGAGADDQGRPEVEAAGADEAREHAQRDLLGREQQEVEEAEEDEKPAADEIEPQAEDQKDEDRRSAEGDLARGPDLLAERQRPVAAVEARGREQEPPDRQDEEQEQEVLVQGKEGQREEASGRRSAALPAAATRPRAATPPSGRGP